MSSKSSSSQLEGNYSDEEIQIHGIAFSKLISYIEEEVNASSENIPVMILSELIQIYCTYLKELGLDVEKRQIHSTRFKNRILSQFDDISAYNQGKEVVLMCQRDIGVAVISAAAVNYDDEGFILAKAAQILRRDIIAQKYKDFNGEL